MLQNISIFFKLFFVFFVYIISRVSGQSRTQIDECEESPNSAEQCAS